RRRGATDIAAPRIAPVVSAMNQGSNPAVRGGMTTMRIRYFVPALLAALSRTGASAFAETVKVGVINTYSGPLAAAGEQMERGIKLYMKLHEKELPSGVTIELIRRDDTGPNPEVAKRLAQELITRDKVQLLTGVVWTP